MTIRGSSCDHRWNFVKKDGDGAMQYLGFSESVAYIDSKLREHAPIHGLCGFSQVTCSQFNPMMPYHQPIRETTLLQCRVSTCVQGAAIAALLTSYQRQGELLQSVDMLKFCLLFAGVMSRLEEHRSAYMQPIACPSLHVIGIVSSFAGPPIMEPCQIF